MNIDMRSKAHPAWGRAAESGSAKLNDAYFVTAIRDTHVVFRTTEYFIT